ncbi:hypothetical protein BCR33DRAFT_738178 [Rhizoclosmatium globosum]|uniref:CUB domain-containing protein n=1 Tax=Rhizoclosmatium globosum TaxID=329046 RepID=A0A1Y2CAD1_9FUNG|nr:hypothetical protein BCR33DRAFT_738178 [Rhizoclosmatium globosum]|eukprot:ORY43993.1 hypothetical protein BCR33DRAFT_738178 [Rhizoclosmatium globosum]
MIARVLAIALATAASFVAAIPGGGPATSSSSQQHNYRHSLRFQAQIHHISPASNGRLPKSLDIARGTIDSICSSDWSHRSKPNDDGSSNQTYLNNMACQWNLNGPRGYVGVLEFAYFDTECGWDFVFIYDGSTTQSPYTAKLCGNRTAAFGYNDLFVSSSNNFIVQFASDQAVVRKGFLAVFNFVPANSLCQSDRDCNGAGSCLRGQCSCDSTHSGAFCQLSIANYTQFFSRELHSAVYDPTRDIMLVTSGHTLQQFSQLLNDVLIYNFTSKLWTQKQPPIGTMAPAERFCHTTFMMNGTMYLYGGVTNAEDSDMLWKYNIDQNTWNVIQTLGNIHPCSKERLSRMLFVLDLTTFAWKILPNSPFPTWGPTGVYHKATNSLYFTGGYRFAESPIQPTLQYQIDSAMWYNDPSQPYELSMSYAQSFVSPQDSDTMIVWGGYPTTLKPIVITGSHVFRNSSSCTTSHVRHGLISTFHLIYL